MSFLKNKKIFTLIICCYNQEKFLSHCLKSLINQKYNKRKFNIIFVDDNSKDNSLKLAKKILNKKNNCEIISNKKNIGLTKSCNKALKKTKTKYFIRVDSDDIISKKLLYYFEKEVNKNPDLIFCDRIEFNKSSKLIVKNKNKDIFKMISCGTALKTKKVVKIGGYKDIKWEEFDLYIRYLSDKSKIINIKKNIYFYRKHKLSMSSNKNWLRKAWTELFKKYGKENLRKYGDIVI